MTRSGRIGFAVVALAGIALFASLGQWQWQRAKQKQQMLTDTAAMLKQRDAVALDDVIEAPVRDFAWVEGRGHFDARGPLLLDNQQRNGRSGVRVFRLFVTQARGVPLLVDLGWLPLPADRTLPTVAPIEGTIDVSGLLMPPPSAGLALGTGIASAGEGWLLTRIDMAAIAAATGLSVQPAPRVLRLDPDLPLGYTRDLDILPNTLPPEKHRGYAVQWWALSVTVLVVWLVLGLRRKTSHKP